MDRIRNPRQAVNTAAVDQVKLTFQGGLVSAKVRRSAAAAPVAGGGIRSVITEFSPASRRRLLRALSILDVERASFVTLTYPRQFPGPELAKNHLRSFNKRLLRRFPAASGLWRMEFQQRGAPHFHALWFNLPYIAKIEVQMLWADVIGCPGERIFTRIEAIHSRRRIIGYLSKYVAKVGGGVGGFNYSAYLTADGRYLHPQRIEPLVWAAAAGCFRAGWAAGVLFAVMLGRCADGQLGRWWGYINMRGLPVAAKTELMVTGDLAPFYRLRRYARRCWRGINRREGGGWTLHVNYAPRWFELYLSCLLE